MACGRMIKVGSFIKSWNERYFILGPDGILRYYDTAVRHLLSVSPLVRGPSLSWTR